MHVVTNSRKTIVFFNESSYLPTTISCLFGDSDIPLTKIFIVCMVTFCCPLMSLTCNNVVPSE